MMFSSISSDLDPSNWQQPQYQHEGFNWPNLHHANNIIHPNNPSTVLPPQPPPPTTGPMGRPCPIPRPIPLAVKCPRCESTNTKFCYYNNRSLSQPRHWCRSCRRHWTRGGALRTVPIGGTRRKNKRSKSSTSSSGASSSATPAPMQGLTNYNEHSRVLVPPELPPPQFPSGFEAELLTFEIGHVIGLNEMEEIAQVDGEFANAYFTC